MSDENKVDAADTATKEPEKKASKRGPRKSAAMKKCIKTYNDLNDMDKDKTLKDIISTRCTGIDKEIKDKLMDRFNTLLTDIEEYRSICKNMTQDPAKFQEVIALHNIKNANTDSAK